MDAAANRAGTHIIFGHSSVANMCEGRGLAGRLTENRRPQKCESLLTASRFAHNLCIEVRFGN